MADATIDVGGKKVKKSTAAIIVIGGLVIAIAVYRSHKAKSAAAAAPAMVTDPDGNTCAVLNPATGFCPGTPGDIAAQQAGASLLGSQAGGYGIGSVGPANNVSATVPVFTDNGSWGQYAEAQMGSDGADAIAAAIGKYLAGVPVTTDQQTIIQQAIAIANYPPVAGTGGFPPSMHLVATPPPTGGGGGTGGGTGLYWTGHGFTQGKGGPATSPKSGFMTIGGKKYYWHADKKYFTLNGRRATPPAGPVT